MGLGDTVCDRVEASVDVLAPNPGLARACDPAYRAAHPPVPCHCHHVPRTWKVTCLTIDERSRVLTMLFVGDAREDPIHRFRHME